LLRIILILVLDLHLNEVPILFDFSLLFLELSHYLHFVLLDGVLQVLLLLLLLPLLVQQILLIPLQGNLHRILDVFIVGSSVRV